MSYFWQAQYNNFFNKYVQINKEVMNSFQVDYRFNMFIQKVIESPNKKDAEQHQLDSETTQYFELQVRPVFSTLISNIIKSKPENIMQFCTKWFRDNKEDEKYQSGHNSSEDEDECHLFDTIDDQTFRMLRDEKIRKGRKKRYGFSSEKTYRQSIKVDKGQKKEQKTYMRILFFCMNSFLFNNFSQKQIGELIEKMRQENFQKDKQVCKEGEYGDRMYFVEEGIFECMQQTQNGMKSVKNYYVGDTFGQICLMHMMKRQASIYCRSEGGVLYTLDRQSYVHFKKMCMIKKRTLYFCTLMKQELFASFREEQLEKVCDVLSQVQFQQGQIVINEGDVGTKFYIILDGISVAYQGKEDNIVRCYKQGDAFGEIALIKDSPRQATVKALTRCRMVFMTRDVFRRIFSNVNLEKQIEQKYANKGVFINKRRPEGGEESREDKKFQDRRVSIRPNRINLGLFKNY